MCLNHHGCKGTCLFILTWDTTKNILTRLVYNMSHLSLQLSTLDCHTYAFLRRFFLSWIYLKESAITGRWKHFGEMPYTCESFKEESHFTRTARPVGRAEENWARSKARWVRRSRMTVVLRDQKVDLALEVKGAGYCQAWHMEKG